MEDTDTILNMVKKQIDQQNKKIKKVSVVRYGEGMVEQMVSVFDIIKKIC